jgi:hypothetical protein
MRDHAVDASRRVVRIPLGMQALSLLGLEETRSGWSATAHPSTYVP